MSTREDREAALSMVMRICDASSGVKPAGARFKPSAPLDMAWFHRLQAAYEASCRAPQRGEDDVREFYTKGVEHMVETGEWCAVMPDEEWQQHDKPDELIWSSWYRDYAVMVGATLIIISAQVQEEHLSGYTSRIGIRYHSPRGGGGGWNYTSYRYGFVTRAAATQDAEEKASLLVEVFKTCEVLQ